MPTARRGGASACACNVQRAAIQRGRVLRLTCQPPDLLLWPYRCTGLLKLRETKSCLAFNDKYLWFDSSAQAITVVVETGYPWGNQKGEKGPPVGISIVLISGLQGTLRLKPVTNVMLNANHQAI